MAKNRILIISHGHPDLSKGGAEVASYNLFKELLNQKEDAYYLARTARLGHPGSSFSIWNNNDREILLHTHMHDYFNFSNISPYQFTDDFTDFLNTLKPEIVHFHHFLHIGLEAIRIVKNALPKTKIIFTLHEYLSICDNSGQMIKNTTIGHQLCNKYTPAECNMCFPSRTPSDYYLRESRIKSFFHLVDIFISPSIFLIDRYINWGLPKEKFHMIENAHNHQENENIKRINSKGKKTQFGYFGQINKFKGIDVLLKAISLLPESDKEGFHLHIHGANLESQPEEFQNKIKELFNENKNIITYHGKYESDELKDLVHDIDWVIVPSIWWENSPMVIQEVFNLGIPIIGSNIGGIKEKIENSGGVLFKYNNPQDLAKTISSAMSEKIWSETIKKIKKTDSIEVCTKKHLNLYKSA